MRKVDLLRISILAGMVILVMAAPLATLANDNVHATYLWHLQQPIYWPDQSLSAIDRYQTAYESIQLKNGGATHPENNLEEIFGKADRVAVYQYRASDAVSSISGYPDGGAQLNYSGCLIENVKSLADFGWNGGTYSPTWNNSYSTARGWTTSGGKPRLDIVAFSFHHVIAPLVDPEALHKEIQIHRRIYEETFGTSPVYSNGFFPAEICFSEHIIQTLTEEGLDWVIVANNHISRAVENFPLTLGSGGENCDPPNKADQINPAQSNWYNQQIDRGCGPTNAYPLAFTPHYTKYVDPETGTEHKMVAVPADMVTSWTDGYGCIGTSVIDSMASENDPTHPMLFLMAHDGDNAFGGGYSYYNECVNQFASEANGKGYSMTTIEQYLADHPPDPSFVVHVEDGGWVNADGDFGSPQFINWNWPLVGAGGEFDIPNGWAEDERNWAVITAAHNRVETAEQIAGGADIGEITHPSAGASPAELAWHYYLAGLTSGYMYYGKVLDMEVKQTIACNEAVEHADVVIGDASLDQTAPTIWYPQRLPWNPGGTGYGSLWGYTETVMDNDFYVWTFVHDVSGVSNVTLYYRLDVDDVNPLSSNQNETYAGGAEVGAWQTIAMIQRAFPTGNVYSDPEINFFELPTYIADEYYARIEGYNDVLIDYYIEAVDTKGYTKKSPISHVYVGENTGGGPGPGDKVNWAPENPAVGGDVTISFDVTQSNIADSTDPVYIHRGYNNWDTGVADFAMTYNSGTSRWEHTLTGIPSYVEQIDFVFHDNAGTWDNNSGSDWHITVSGGTPPAGFTMDGALDASATEVATDGTVTLWAGYDSVGGELYVASQTASGTGRDRFIFVSDSPGSLGTAPWAKDGQVAAWEAYLANEENNNYNAWFDAVGNTGNASGSYLEGTLNLVSEFGYLPGIVYLAVGSYESFDNGTLMNQAPDGEGNFHIESDEYAPFSLNTPVDSWEMY
ncbi:MAG: hypothetical protein JW860_08185 [Sedimentisphaerales bacterium]|nr:hypothetical protein [Sedimentisphaerales bacterium]